MIAKIKIAIRHELTYDCVSINPIRCNINKHQIRQLKGDAKP